MSKLEYALVLVVVLCVLAVVVSVVAPAAQAEIALALQPLQDALQSVPVQ